jgi:hypothetical protein
LPSNPMSLFKVCGMVRSPELMERQKASQIKNEQGSESPLKYARGNRTVFHAFVRGKLNPGLT